MRGLFPLLSLLFLTGCSLGWWGENSLGYGELALQNQRTLERSTIIYREPDGRLVSEGLMQANWLMRDLNTQQVMAIDPRLLDFMVRIRQKLDLPPEAVFVITSGYRSPETNSQLRAKTGRAAEKSYHLKGMAVDFKLPGVSLSRIAGVALDLKRGGVAYYDGTDHVHIDTGPVRTWSGS